MPKKYLKNNWRKLDNTAKIFSLDNKKNANIFRYSVILKQDIDKVLLKNALKISLDEYSSFKVKIGTGLFWNYLKYNSKEPIVKEDKEVLCKSINLKENNEHLFRITYYKNKINLDIFHILTDGNGAIKFLKSIIYNYLDLKHNISSNKRKKFNNNNLQDQYIKNYDRTLNEKMNFKKAYSLKEKANKKINNTYHYLINTKEIKAICKGYNITITEYLTSLYIYAIYLSLYNKKSNKEIVIAVPIDLRKYYKVDTISNFFVCMNIIPKIANKNLITFNDILNEVKREFKEKLNEEKIKRYLARDTKIGRNISINLIPLFIKKLFIKYAGFLINNTSTSTLSNVGIIDIDDQYKTYIDNIFALVRPNKFQKIKCTICSFDKKLNITLNSNINDRKFQETFSQLLRKQINNIKLESNICTNLIKENRKYT